MWIKALSKGDLSVGALGAHYLRRTLLAAVIKAVHETRATGSCIGSFCIEQKYHDFPA
jgi:hypothetical protein